MAPRDEIGTAWQSLASLFLTGAAAAMVSGLKPALVTSYITLLHFSTRQAGYVVAMEMTSATVGTIISGRVVRKLGQRRAAASSLCVLFLVNLLSLTISTFPGLLAVRTLSGFAAGLALGVMVVSISGRSAPDRYMGAYTIVTMLVSACCFAFLPSLLHQFGISAFFSLMTASSGIALVLAPFFPHTQQVGVARVILGQFRQRQLVPSILSLLGTAFYYFSFGLLWPFVEEIGRRTTLNGNQIGGILSLSQIVGALAASLPLILGRRFGRAIPIALALSTALGSAAILALAPGSSKGFTIAIPLAMLGMMLLFPYLMGMIAEIDPLGTLSTTSIAIQSVGLAVGPAWSGHMAAVYSLRNIPIVAGCGYAAALACLLVVASRQDSGFRKMNVLIEPLSSRPITKSPHHERTDSLC